MTAAWKCVQGHDRCAQMLPSANCPYCERVPSNAAKHDAGGKARFALQPGVDGAAAFSECGQYRYWLSRQWTAQDDAPFALWIGMNPSTAEGDVDDPTIRREMAFTRAIGLERYLKVNVMDYRATNPKALLAPGVRPCSDFNIGAINNAAGTATRIIAAWGALPTPLWRYADRAVLAIRAALGVRRLVYGDDKCPVIECMGVTASGAPRHPLYLPNSATPQSWVRP